MPRSLLLGSRVASVPCRMSLFCFAIPRSSCRLQRTLQTEGLRFGGKSKRALVNSVLILCAREYNAVASPLTGSPVCACIEVGRRADNKLSYDQHDTAFVNDQDGSSGSNFQSHVVEKRLLTGKSHGLAIGRPAT